MRRFLYPGRWFLLSAVAILVVGLLWYFAFGFNRPLKDVDPQELFQKALTSTKEVKSYSYRIKTQLTTAKGVRCLSDVHGVRILPDRVSVKGKIFNAPVEIIHIEGVTYVKDRFSNRWLTLEGERLGETGVFITELDPLVLLDFEEEPLVAYGKKERGRSEELYSLQFKPRVRNRFLTAQFTDFEYRVWIEPKTYHIVELQVKTNNKAAPTKLTIDLSLRDFDRAPKIEPPL
ncbi:MAG: hypothetical protein AB1426_05240 [Bacillota bacterium]